MELDRLVFPDDAKSIYHVWLLHYQEMHGSIVNGEAGKASGRLVE
ncbi:hypothetical protein [Candidatus Enterococcus ferrettii]|nr:hypothetical protein [Enterococcus sp. 665A]